MVNRYAEMPPVIVRPRAVDPAAKAATLNTNRILHGIGENPLALNTMAMEQSRLRPLFKGFNPEDISPNELDAFGKQLFAFGLIDNLTADLMGRAALEFDKEGKIANPDLKINALEFFAKRIDDMQRKVMGGDKYTKLLLPDYIKTVHVMKNLQVFASTGDSYSTLAADKRFKNGDMKDKDGKVMEWEPTLKSKV
jgi:hypothetical protein